MIKNIIFDLDGTLINSLPLFIKAYDLALKEQGFTFPKKEVASTCFGKTEAAICQKLNIPDKTKQFKKTYFTGLKRHLKEGKLFNNVLETLNLCVEKQINLAIISFAYRWYVDKMIKRLNLKKYFNPIISFNDVKNPKPNPEAVILACKKLNLQPQHTIVVGDSKSDILMGKAKGCKTVLFYKKGYDLFYDLQTLKESHPDKIVKNFRELKKLILKNKIL